MFSTLCHCWMRYFLNVNAAANCNKILIASLSSKSALNYYETLGIPKTSTQSDIKTAYYKLSMQYHPDKNQGCEDAAQKFREITHAYEVLGNYQMRRLYDKGVIHTADGPEYAQHQASRSASAAVVEEDDDPATKFYKSRMKRTHVQDMSGRTPIYDYDEWSRAHYGYSFQRRREAKNKFNEQEQKKSHDAASKAHEVLLFGMVFAGVVIYASYRWESSYDLPKPATTTINNSTTTTNKEIGNTTERQQQSTNTTT